MTDHRTTTPATEPSQDRSPSAAAVRQEVGQIDVVVETAHVEKVRHLSGRVQVTTQTETVEDVVHDVLEGVAVDVNRVPVDRELSIGEPVPATRQEGETTIVPVLEEVLVVEKRLVLREEIHITQRATQEDVAIPVTLRRQHPAVDRQSGDEPSSGTSE